MKRIVWLTDLHLNFLPGEAVDAFLSRVADCHADAVLVSGDIAESTSVDSYLQWMADRIDCPIYFVLGNHDFYHGSIHQVRARVIDLCKRDARLVWLGDTSTIPLTATLGLVGHDGWADGRLGDYERSLVMMNDYRLIEEFAGADKRERWQLLKQEADVAAQHIARVLPEALARFPRVMLLTHVPPFREACWHAGAISDDEWLPHFTSCAMGETILRITAQHQDRQLTVLCGHTHGRGEAQPATNVRVLTGGAEYRRPRDRTSDGIRRGLGF